MTAGKGGLHTREKVMRLVFLGSSILSLFFLALICIFLFSNGVPALFKIGAANLLLGTDWSPVDTPPFFGLLPMILGSVCVTVGAVIVGTPIGIFTAVFMVYYCPASLYKLMKPAVELLAGIPSIVYGFFGLVLLAPIVRTIFGGSGLSMFTASIILGIMILPTIVAVSEAAIRAVPASCYENAVALGACRERSIFCAVLPAAAGGVTAAVVLGIGRAVGETMAVVMVAGNQARMPAGVFQGLRTMTANIVLEMGYAADLHRDALFVTAALLLIFILIINAILFYISSINRLQHS
ncbi:MAG: phosphate ABC transporter permease subunit PstC [Deferribacteraceae bacterium]|jgi:phosphate transport system permease protein|nr:phosphate ABC transporter permease subunit PstC [Deferribacteraceae bacterium]